MSVFLASITEVFCNPCVKWKKCNNNQIYKRFINHITLWWRCQVKIIIMTNYTKQPAEFPSKTKKVKRAHSASCQQFQVMILQEGTTVVLLLHLLLSSLSTPMGLMTFPELAKTWMMWFCMVHIIQKPGSWPATGAEWQYVEYFHMQTIFPILFRIRHYSNLIQVKR